MSVHSSDPHLLVHVGDLRVSASSVSAGEPFNDLDMGNGFTGASIMAAVVGINFVAWENRR